MKFEKITIKNFRNFENVNIDLSNKNIFFGLNDVGKTNFLYALRYVFDKDIRKQNLTESDFHNKQYDKPIEIIITIDISDIHNSDCQKLRAQLKGALLSKHNKVYIKLFAEYNKTEMIARLRMLFIFCTHNIGLSDFNFSVTFSFSARSFTNREKRF